jgi:hypothetical protein
MNKIETQENFERLWRWQPPAIRATIEPLLRPTSQRDPAMKILPICVSVVLLLQTFALSAADLADPSDKHPGLNLIPWPKALTVHDGKMRLGANLRIATDDTKLRPLADILAGEIAKVTGIKTEVATGTGKPGDIVLKIDDTLKADEPIHAIRDRKLADTTDGAYTLAVSDRAVVTGFDYRAVAEGTATLLQALSRDADGLYLPALTIKDWPRADYCGAMLDIGRQDHSIEAIKQLIELCRIYKVRYIHLHMTDDQGFTFPSTAYPQLGKQNVGAHGGKAPRVYKLDELKGAVAYGDARGVTLVPEFEMPGHSWAARRCMPEVFCAIHPKTGKPVDIACMNMANEKLYPVLDTLIGEMCDVFHSSPYFHIGTDECETNGLPVHAGFKKFLAKHNLKNETEVGSYFINQVNAMIAKRGKKTIKWEGVGDAACKDVICMCWVGNNRTAERLVHEGFTVITCPWGLGVPWPEWSMYVCNGSMLKPTDPVLGATTVMWEQSPAMHLSGARRGLAERQERTWGPDNRFTEQGFGRRWNGTDALAARLAGLSEPKLPAMVESSMPGVGMVDAVRAFDNPQASWQIDGGTATWFESCRAPVDGDHITVTFDRPRAVYELDVTTGHDGRGRLNQGELQTSADGQTFKTIAQLTSGSAQAIVEDAAVKAVRIRCNAQSENVIVDDIRLRLMRQISGTVNDVHKIAAGDYAVCAGDAVVPNIGQCGVNFVNKAHTLTLGTGGGNADTLTGVLSGSGTVVFQAAPASSGLRDSPLTLAGDQPNTLGGTYHIKQGRVVLAKREGVSALTGRIIVGGQGGNDCLCWAANDQISHCPLMELLDSPHGGAYLDLNGHSERLSELAMAAHTRIVTGGGILRVRQLKVEGREMPTGVYAGEPWCQGSGMVLVGDVPERDVSGTLAQSTARPSVLRLTGPTTVNLTGDCADVYRTGNFTLSLGVDDKYRCYLSGFITGDGNLDVASGNENNPRTWHMEFGGTRANSYRGVTRLTRGMLRLAKPAGVTAIPGDLIFGGDAVTNKGDTVGLDNDNQIGEKATVTMAGDKLSILAIGKHKQNILRMILSSAATVLTEDGGELRAKLVTVAGKAIPPGIYTSTSTKWIQGDGKVIVDPHTDVSGSLDALAPGLIARLTGDTLFGWGVLAFDIETNGHTVHFDSGNGNADTIAGSISGTGNVKFSMGPYHTGFRDAPMVLAGSKANTASGTYYVAKGRVQFQKPAGVDAIAGNVVVGGQGYNDCLRWENDEQIKDSAKITLIESPSNGASYLDLNGCTETVAALVMTPNNKIKTDSGAGKSGTLKIRKLTIGGVDQPPGTYTAARAPWLEGRGKVIVGP